MKKNMFRNISSKTLMKTAVLVSLIPFGLMAKEAEPKLPEAMEKEQKNTFFSGSSLNGGFFLMGRNRDRLDATTPDSIWNDNLDHISTMASLKYTSKDFGKIFGFELGGFAVFDMYNGEPSGVNQENEFSFAGEHWSENWEDGRPRNGVSVTNATAHFKFPFGLKLMGGLGQLGIEGVIGNNWSYMPGSHIGAKLEWNIADRLNISYAWIDRYKAPWFRKTQVFSKENAWGSNPTSKSSMIDYIHGASIKFHINDNHNLTASVGNSEGYMMNYFGKYAGHLGLADGFDYSYQLYVSDIYDDDNQGLYDGFAQYHVLTTALNANHWNFKLEGTHTIAEGSLGNYLPRLTRGYANSQGGFQVWWDMRSDWNENGETAIFANISRKLDDLLRVPGWTLGVGGAIGFGATYEGTKYRDEFVTDSDGNLVKNIQYKDLDDGTESAWKVDLSYTTDIGRFKGATFAVHYMQYYNHQSEYGNWMFPNMFSSERDLMVKAILPFGQSF